MTWVNLSSCRDFDDLNLVNGVLIMISLEKDDILKSNCLNLAGGQQLSYKHFQARKFSLKNVRTFSVVSLGRGW